MPPPPTPLRADFDALKVREAARKSPDGAQVRRLLTLAAIYEGASRGEAARLGGVTVQVVRDWVVRFNAHGQDGLIDRKRSGRPSTLNAAHRTALAAAIESGPIPAIHGVVRWRLIDLMQWLWDEFSVSVSKPTLGHMCGPWAIASSRHVHVIMPKSLAPSTVLKKLPGHPGQDRVRKEARCRPDRDLVRRRGAHRTEEQDRPALGQARHQAFGAKRSTDRLDLHFRCDLP